MPDCGPLVRLTVMCLVGTQQKLAEAVHSWMLNLWMGKRTCSTAAVLLCSWCCCPALQQVANKWVPGAEGAPAACCLLLGQRAACTAALSGPPFPALSCPPLHCRRMRRRLLPGSGFLGSPRVMGRGLPVPAELQQPLSGKVGLVLQSPDLHCHQLTPVFDEAMNKYTHTRLEGLR